MEGLLGAVTECMLACLWAMVEQEGWVWVVSVALRRRADSQLAGELHEREVIPCTPGSRSGDVGWRLSRPPFGVIKRAKG
jgi:hypothetical protein